MPEPFLHLRDGGVVGERVCCSRREHRMHTDAIDLRINANSRVRKMIAAGSPVGGLGGERPRAMDRSW